MMHAAFEDAEDVTRTQRGIFGIFEGAGYQMRSTRCNRANVQDAVNPHNPSALAGSAREIGVWSIENHGRRSPRLSGPSSAP